MMHTQWLNDFTCPFHSIPAVVGARGVDKLWSQPVVNIYHFNSGIVAHMATPGCLGVEVSKDPSP